MRARNFLTGITLALALGAALWFERRAQRELRAQNRELREEIERLRRVRAVSELTGDVQRQTASSSSEGADRELLRLRGEAALLRRQKNELEQLRAENHDLRSNLLARVLDYDAHLHPDQIQSFLDVKGRNAASLLTAFNLTRDKALLQEAITNYPSDPKVNLAATMAEELKGQTRQWLDAFKQSAPENSLANYLSAQDYFKSGQTNLALQELAVATGKLKMEDYSAESFRSLAEAYILAGYPEGVAKAAAWSEARGSPLNDLYKLQRSLAAVANAYRQAGDAIGAQDVLQMGLRLGQRLADESIGLKTEDQEGIGLSIQRLLLEKMDPASPYDATGQTVKDRLEELARRRSEIGKLNDPPGWDGYILKALSEQDLLDYFDRMQTSSESEARRWAASHERSP